MVLRAERRPEFSVLFWRAWERVWWVFAILLCAGFFYLALRDPVLLVRILGLFLLFGGLTSLLVGWRARKLAEESPFWPSVSGRVLESAVRKETSTSSVGSRVSTVTSYFPEIEYEYDYQGRHYHSSRVLVARVNFPESEARAAVDRCPVGSEVMVFVNPRRPRIAILEPGLAGREGKYRIPFIVGGGLTLLGIIAITVATWIG